MHTFQANLQKMKSFFDSGEKVKDIFSPLSSKIADLTQDIIGISERVIKRCPFLISRVFGSKALSLNQVE